MPKALLKNLSDARILVSNDDGIHAPGLKLLERVARSLSKDVWVIAPEAEQSGASHGLTLRRPLPIHKIGPRRFAVAVEGLPGASLEVVGATAEAGGQVVEVGPDQSRELRAVVSLASATSAASRARSRRRFRQR